MSAFSDQLLLQFLQDNFVRDLLTNQLGLSTLLTLIYKLEDVELKQVELAGVQRREFEFPAFETIYTSGINEQIMPTAGRIKVDRSQPRNGRLAWVDVLLDVLVSAKVASKRMPIEKITTQDLIDKLGGVTSMTDLRNKLAALYPPSVVDAFFNQLGISSVDDFKSRPALFLEFIYQAPPPFDPNDPKNARNYKVNVCVQFQAEFKIGEPLQTAKLCRSILENEKDFVQNFDDGEINTPYAFVVIFADSAIVDGAFPNLTAAQIKTDIKSLFQAERMVAHFV
ncbi:MAG: hypothetical protein WCH01_00420 [Methylococcaceae bacterium]